jgi:uncharacterized coiled-coil protein SlyX
LEANVAALEAKLARKDAVVAEVSEMYVARTRMIHDSFCCKLAFLAPRVFRPRCSLRRTARSLSAIGPCGS